MSVQYTQRLTVRNLLTTLRNVCYDCITVSNATTAPPELLEVTFQIVQGRRRNQEFSWGQSTNLSL